MKEVKLRREASMAEFQRFGEEEERTEFSLGLIFLVIHIHIHIYISLLIVVTNLHATDMRQP